MPKKPVRRASLLRGSCQNVFPLSVSGGGGFPTKLHLATPDSGLDFVRVPWHQKLPFGRPKVAKRKGLGGHFGAILRVGPKSANRCFTYTGAHFLRVRRVSKSLYFETSFKRGAKCIPGRHFSQFCWFSDAPWHPIFLKMAPTFRVLGPLQAPKWTIRWPARPKINKSAAMVPKSSPQISKTVPEFFKTHAKTTALFEAAPAKIKNRKY